LIAAPGNYEIADKLNKGESLHSLRRDLFFAHDGAVRRRHRDAQNVRVRWSRASSR